MANRNQPIDLSIWIDTWTGGIIKSLTQRDMEDLLNKVYSVGDDIFKRLYQRFPSMELPCVPELQIQLSGELIPDFDVSAYVEEYKKLNSAE